MRPRARVVYTAFFFFCFTRLLFAQEATGTAPLPPSGFWPALLDNAVGLTIFFILVSAIVGALIKHRRRDRVLKSFDGYRVIVVLDDGRRIWGKLRVFPNGVEVNYETPSHDDSGHEEVSFVLHEAELLAVRAILRPTARLGKAMEKRRKKEIASYIRPSFFRRTERFILIQFSILRDAVSQSFAVLIGQAKMSARGTSRFGSVLKSQDTRITEIGKTVITSVNLTNDPILESFFGQACVVEVRDEGTWRELTGFLKEYSADWLEMLRCAWPAEFELNLVPGEVTTAHPEWKIAMDRAGGRLSLKNGENRNVEILSIHIDGEEAELEGVEILSGGEWLPPSEVSLDSHVTMRLIYLEPGDLILPRSKALVRHRIPQENLSLLENLGIRR